MDISTITAMNALTANDTSALEKALKTSGIVSDNNSDDNMFTSIFNAALDNIKETNDYLSAAENEEIKFALGETDSTHDLAIALQKASTALQYTVAVRNKFLEAYKEIMQMQI